jgi:integrase
MGSGGSVRQRSNGLWEARFRQDGRQRSVYGKTKREAQERLRVALTAADNGLRPVAQRVTVGAFLAEWLAGSVATRNRPRTIESYQQTVDRYIVPWIGGIPLARLEPSDVDRMRREVRARGVSATTARYAVAVLRIALSRALKDGRVVRNVAKLVDLPKAERPNLTPLTAEESRRLLEAAAEHRFGPLFTLAVATGMRQGELLALRWQDVDLDAGMLHVRYTLQEGTRERAEPKTERSRRTIGLATTGVTALREQRRRQLEARLAAGRRWRDEDYVFATAVGTPLDGRNVTHELQATLVKAGLPRQRFHDLRHTHATLRLEAGDDLYSVSRSLGHSSITTTADTYGHITPAMQERSAALVDRILSA